MPHGLTATAWTDIGRLRPNNEDAWWIGLVEGAHATTPQVEATLELDPAAGAALLIVSDGIGGQDAGELASHLATTETVASLQRLGRETPAARLDAPRLAAAIREANGKILAEAKARGGSGMGATLVLAAIDSRGGLIWANLGDSRLYLRRNGTLRQVTTDHSLVGGMRRAGELTEEEARRHPLRHQIDRWLGSNDSASDPDFGTETLQPGDVLMLCSDGLSDGLTDARLGAALAGVRAARDVRTVAHQLVEDAKASSGRDNITVVVARWHGAGN